MEGFEGHPEAERALGACREVSGEGAEEGPALGAAERGGRFVEWRTGSGGDQKKGLRGDLEAGIKMEVGEGG